MVWEQLWSEARYDFHLSHDEFMRLLPRTFAAMRKRRDLEHQRQELLVGILAANVANYSTWKLKEPATPADFMPSRIGREESDEETMIRLMRSMSSDAITTN